MSEKQFDIFDEPFRQAAEQIEPEFNEASWIKMEAKLDKSLRRRPVRWFFWLTDITIIAVMLTLAVELQKTKLHDNSKQNNLQLSETQNNKTTGDIKEKSKPAESVTGAKINEIKKENNADTVTASYTRGDVKTAPSAKQNNQISKGDPKPGQANAGKKVMLSQKNNKLSSTYTTGVALPEGANYKQPDLNAEQPAATQYANAAAHKNNKTNTLAARQTPVKDGFADVVIDDDYELLQAGTSKLAPSTINAANSGAGSSQPADTANAKPKVTRVNIKQQKAFKGLYLQAGVSPEWSFIHGNAVGPLRTAYGGAIGFATGGRWSVQAGFYVTQKVYEGGPGTYKAKPGTYFYNLKINHVSAYCNVLELPVTVNYSLLSSRQHRLVASAGFSSVVMQKEIYHYNFERSNGTPGYYKHTYETGTFHPFAVAAISAGYQYSLTNRLSLQLLPYVKVPIYGIGEGAVKITSAGFVMGMQYGFARFKAKPAAKQPTATGEKP